MQNTEKTMKNKIFEVLKQVKYPGYNRDIVSFGMVDEVHAHDNHIHVKLAIKMMDINVLRALMTNILFIPVTMMLVSQLCVFLLA